jgi:serine/threonine protein kinase
MNEYIPNRYKILQKIGEGVHGVVLKAIDTHSNDKVVAIKKVPLRTKFGGNFDGKLTEFGLILDIFRNLTKYTEGDQVLAAC